MGMPYLYVINSTSDFTAIVTKGYEEIVKETLTGVLQTFHEKITVTKLETGSSKCCKFLLKANSATSITGYPRPGTNENISLAELHVVLLEEMHKMQWRHIANHANYGAKPENTTWTFQSFSHEMNEVL